MARINLKNIISKKNDVNIIVLELIKQLNAEIWVEDFDGKLLLGTAKELVISSCPVLLEDELLGWVRGDEKGMVIADLLMDLAKKEIEKKRLGTEMLNLYQEINIIFDFTEKLTQTIEPDVIAGLTLEQALHSTPSESGLIVLWDEHSRQLLIPASSGESLFNEESIRNNAELLFKIGLSGQSEIMHDISILKEKNIIENGVQSVMYAAMKVKHRIMGAIILASRGNEQFAALHLKLLVTLALQSSAAIESALLFEKNIREVRKREEAILQIHEVTKKFVPNEFIRSLGKDRLTDVMLGDQVEKNVTVLFSDIRDYTTIAEQMTPSENFHFVCSFNEKMGPIIRQHNGFINQYLGDAIMAIFPGNATDALAAAVQMQIAVQQLNAERQINNQRPIQIGIGMHSGPLIMGITGDENRLDATTISDTVNTASRIENLTKYYKASIIISDATLQQLLNPEKFHLRPLGIVQVKGKLALVGIHECFSGNEPAQMQKKLANLSVFNSGISNYLNKSFDDAYKDFQLAGETNPEDLTVHFFLSKTATYIDTGVPENWIGVEKMSSK